ncbi:MAG: hypothetical protein ACI4JK_02235 [Oscillospiraceae bacterium]
MGMYVATYKCPLCGTLSRIGELHEVNYNDLPKLLGKVMQSQPFLSKVPLYATCKCKDGNAGFVKV